MIMATTRRIARRLGRRGAMLTLMGVTYILLGLGVLVRPPTFIEWNFLSSVPAWLRGGAWIASGLVACGYAWRRMPAKSRAWTAGDGIGWSALYVLPFFRVASYSGAWIGYLISGHGYAGAWYVALLHVPFLLITLICSGWREDVPPREEAAHE